MINGILLHSVSYAGTWGQPALSLEQIADKAALLGFNGLMIMAKRPHFSVLDSTPENRAALRRKLESRNLTNVCIAAYTNFTADPAHGEVPHSEYQIHSVTELARAGSELGARGIRVFTGYDEPAVPFQRQWDAIVRCLRELADRCAAYGVVVGVQNHHDMAADYESLHDLVTEVGHENCRAMFDAWAPALQGADISAAARKLGGMTIHTTVANYQTRPRYRYAPALVHYEEATPRTQAVGMREGFIDYTAFFDALAEAGFRGSVAYEMCSPLRGGASEQNLDAHARQFVEWMREYEGRSRQAAKAF